MVRVLVRADADPKTRSRDVAPWPKALELVSDFHHVHIYAKEKYAHIKAWFEIIRIFILVGVDPKADHNSRNGSHVRDVSKAWDSKMARKLERLATKKTGGNCQR